MSSDQSPFIFGMQIGVLVTTLFLICVLLCILWWIWDWRDIDTIQDRDVEIAVVPVDPQATRAGQATASAPLIAAELCPIDQAVYRGMADRARPVVGVEYVP